MSVVIELACRRNLEDVSSADIASRKRYLHASREAISDAQTTLSTVSTTVLEQTMLSEDTSRLPILSSTGQATRQRLAGLGWAIVETLGRFMRQFRFRGRRGVSELPDDLYSDVGLLPPTQERTDAFWQSMQLSAGRNLPL
jgi:hypothetical protein